MTKAEYRKDIGSNKKGIEFPSSKHRPAFSPEWTTKADSGYSISEHLLGEPPATLEPFTILCMGAGASGIDFLHHAVTLKSFEGLNVQVKCYEKNADIGGTWLENRYPGCACDIPSVSYQFPWKPKPDWTTFYATAPEIWQYMKDIIQSESLDSYIHLQTEITSAVWDQESRRWVVKSKCSQDGSEKEERFHYLVNASGFLNAWKWPDIPGLQDFTGELYHTASFKQDSNFKGKRVAVIGSGSSGVQTVAAVYPDVEQLYHWVRSPIWVTAGYGSRFAGTTGENFQYSEQQKQVWADDDAAYLSYRKMVERELNIRFKFILRNTAEAEEALQFSYAEMCRRLSYNDDLIAHIIPTTFNVGCRRPTPGTGYLETLVAPKTKVFFDTVHRITPDGFQQTEGGEVFKVDAIICATGFDTSFRPRFPIVGLDGHSISELWKDHALGYISSAVPHMPNYFTYFGPYGPVAQGSLLPIATALSQNLIAIIKKMRLEHISSLTPKASVVEQFGEHVKLYHKRTAWTDPCRSWFKQGRVDANPIVWPGTRLHYMDVLSVPRFEDFDIEYESGNRWGWLGNGFSIREYNGGDVTHYLGPETEDERRQRLANDDT